MHLSDFYFQHSKQLEASAIVETLTSHGDVLTFEEMEMIWLDILNIVTPSWMTSIPSNLESSCHGKLKADQWHVLGTTHLPFSLVCLWGLVEAGNNRSERCNKILHVTISLLSAILIASSHTTSQTHGDLYLQHMQAYIMGVKQLFPNYAFWLNHHMALHLHEYLLQYGPVHGGYSPLRELLGCFSTSLPMER